MDTPPSNSAQSNSVLSGTFTFLFTDIEGSTKRWERHPDAMHAVIAHHDALMREIIEAHGGHVFKTVGDAFCVAFPVPQQAVASAIAAQKAFHSEDWGETGPIRVRMALHTGAVEVRDGDYFGPPLNRVARLLSAGHGGQTLLSEVTQGLVRDALPKGVNLHDMGAHRLKDLTRPEHVFELVVSGLSADFPALKTLDARLTNLPIQLTPLIGREREVAEVSSLLTQPDVRLLTLTGPGGMGKTRLGLQVAAEMLEEFADGVYFVSLAPISDLQLVLPTIAQVLRVQEEGEQPLAELLKQYLQDKQMLLLVDNFEQVAAAVPVLAELLMSAPSLKALVTSREVLRVRGEREFAVPPLSLPPLPSLPDGGKLPSLGQMAQYDAIRLFVERASEAQTGFELTGHNARTVAEICVQLDGLPLAIELAAARVKLLPPQQMLARLSSKLKLLTGGARDLPARQQTLRGAIDWSYELLDRGEQKLFAQLAVFVGGCTLDEAEAICNGAAAELDLYVLDGLASLVNKSLTRRQETEDGEVRFSMLETIREYAAQKLEESDGAGAVRRRHAEFFLALAEEAEPELRGMRQGEWFGRLEAEIGNFRTAVGWALEQGEAEMVARLGGALWRFLWTFGYLSEGRRWLEAAVRGPALTPAVRAKALYPAGILAHEQGDMERSESFFRESLAIRRELGDNRGIANSLNALGMVAKHGEDYEQATEYFQESLALRWDLGDKQGISVALNNLGSVAHSRGDYAAAIQMYEQSLEMEREFGDNQGIAAALNNLAEVAVDRGEPARASELYRESLALCLELGDKQGMLVSLEGLAVSAGAQGEVERAATLFGACAALREMSGTQLEHGYVPAYERQVAEVRAAMDPSAWQAAWEQGGAMSFEQAYSYALAIS